MPRLCGAVTTGKEKSILGILRFDPFLSIVKIALIELQSQ
jgi:hypothetical protein